MALKINTSNPFLVKLVRCRVGHEEDVVEVLGNNINTPKKRKEAFYGKVIGDFDVIEVRKTDRLMELIAQDSDYRILDMATFPCLLFSECEVMLENSMKRAKTAALVLVKFDSEHVKRHGLNWIIKKAETLLPEGKATKAIKKIFSHSKIGNRRFKIVPMLGIGHFELVLWVECSDYKQLFLTAECLRSGLFDIYGNRKKIKNHKNNIIAHTVTIPIISYKTVLNKRKWDQIGNSLVTPSMSIKCMPGHEIEIITALKGMRCKCKQVFGADDLIAKWDSEIPLEMYIQNIFKFRDEQREKRHVLATTTKLIAGHDIDPNHDWNINRPTELEPGISEQLEKLGEATDNPFLAAELINVVRRVNTLLGNRAMGSGGEIELSLLRYLNPAIENFVNAYKSGQLEDARLWEHNILNFASRSRAALTQRYSNIEQADVTSRPTFALSLSMIISAISIIPEQIIGVITNSAPPKRLKALSRMNDEKLQYELGRCDHQLIKNILKEGLEQFEQPWLGFVYLEMPHGYRHTSSGEIFSVPYKDIFACTHWLTLTHEIAHWYSYRAKLIFAETKSIIQVDIRDNSNPQTYSTYSKSRTNTVDELFAHWFDYVHFFDEDFEFYMWSIWNTYAKTPVVLVKLHDYIVRSLFIWYCHNRGRYSSQLKIAKSSTGLDRRDAIRDILEVGAEEIQQIIRPMLINFNKNPSESLFDEKVMQSCVNYLRMAEVFDKYRDQDLKTKLNDPNTYKDLDHHTDAIMQGEVITDKISNPFLLLKNIHHKQYLSRNEAKHARSDSLGISQCIAIIVSFAEAYRALINES